jgi:alkylation response protein AidB-like acyl-CoA dehydrogenase
VQRSQAWTCRSPEDQEALRDAFETLLGHEARPERVRAVEPLGFDPALWKLLVGMDAVSMAVPAASGGGGLGLGDLGVLAELLGRRLAPVPLLEAQVASRLLARAGAEDVLGRVVGGDQLVTLALRPGVEGTARLVPAGAVADVVVALDGTELVAVEARPEDSAHPLQSLGSAPLADRDLRSGTIRVLAEGTEAACLLAGAVAEWKVLTAAALIGLGAEALDFAVAYVRERRQFGVPIGSFQVIQHRLADLASEIDGGRLLAQEAAWAADEHEHDAAALGAMAFAYAASTAQHAAAESLHFHGGYGFMLEYDIQLYFRRAKAWALVYDDPRREYQQVAELLWGPPEAP